MRTFVIVSCLAAVAVAQFPPQVPGFRESPHFQALNQPHLPKDTNVLHATRQFLDKFAELKALAEAAPDPGHAGRQPQAAPQQFAANPHRFAAPQQAAPRRVQQTITSAPSRPATGEFDVTAEIRNLLARHQAANPTPAPRQATTAPRRAPVQQAPVQQRAPAVPTFSALNNFGAQRPQQAQAPRFVQASVQPINSQIVTHNQQGQVINPKRFPGPLAHTVPAGVTGRVQNTQFTAEVAAAHRHLASAHASILKQQAALPRPRQ